MGGVPLLAGPLERGLSVPHLTQTENMKESIIIGTFKLSKNKIAGFFSTYSMNFRIQWNVLYSALIGHNTLTQEVFLAFSI